MTQRQRDILTKLYHIPELADANMLPGTHIDIKYSKLEKQLTVYRYIQFQPRQPPLASRHHIYTDEV